MQARVDVLCTTEKIQVCAQKCSLVATTGLTAQKIWTRLADKRHDLDHSALEQARSFWTSGNDALLLARHQEFGPTVYAISSFATISQ